MRTETTASTHVSNHQFEDLLLAIDQVGNLLTAEDPKGPFKAAGLDLKEVIEVLACAEIPAQADRVRAALGVTIGLRLASNAAEGIEREMTSPAARTYCVEMLGRAVERMGASITDDGALAPPFTAVGLDPMETLAALEAVGVSQDQEEQLAVATGIILGLHLADVA